MLRRPRVQRPVSVGRRRGRAVRELLVVLLAPKVESVPDVHLLPHIGDFRRVIRRARHLFVDVEMLRISLAHPHSQVAHSMRPHLEDEVPEVQHKQQDRHAVAHRQQIRRELALGDAEAVAGRGRVDAEVERGRDEHGDDSNEQERRVELGRGGLDRLLGVSHTAGKEAHAEHEQDVGEDGADQRRLHDGKLALG